MPRSKGIFRSVDSGQTEYALAAPFVRDLGAHHLLGRIFPERAEVATDAELERLDIGKLACQVIVLLFRIQVEIVEPGIGEALEHAGEASRARGVARIVAGRRQHHLVLAAAQA